MDMERRIPLIIGIHWHLGAVHLLVVQQVRAHFPNEQSCQKKYTLPLDAALEGCMLAITQRVIIKWNIG
jgi:hypothetical protein